MVLGRELSPMKGSVDYFLGTGFRGPSTESPALAAIVGDRCAFTFETLKHSERFCQVLTFIGTFLLGTGVPCYAAGML